MTLIDSFFYIADLSHTQDEVYARLRLNTEHPVYAGHFPDQPVFPGALMVQTISEILGRALGAGFQISRADSIKFLTVLDPKQHPEIELAINYTEVQQGIMIDARLFAGAVIFFKLKAALKSA